VIKVPHGTDNALRTGSRRAADRDGRAGAPAPGTPPPRPGEPAGAEDHSTVRLVRRGRQLSDARAEFQVADGRMTASALAFSGWK
jgi:hypothetical protein